MKVSELIKILQSMERDLGDLKVSISVAMHDNIYSEDEDIHVGYEQYKDGDEINIRNFVY